MISKEGSAAIFGNNLRGSSGGNSSDSSFYARVIYTLLEDDPIKLKEMEVPKGTIGAVQCQVIGNSQTNTDLPPIVAFPSDSLIKRFPLENEVVHVIVSVSYKSNNPKDNSLKRYYYDKIINIWDSTEHNAIPDISFFKSGSTSVTGDFKETGKVSKLKHGPGDFTLESRFGSSFRFGASNDFKDTPWKGSNGSPVVVLRNGQKESKVNIPLLEDADLDGSSFYMLSGQALDFTPASLNFDSYKPRVPTTVKNKIITATPTLTSVEPTGSVQDKPTVKYDTPVSISSETSADEELEFLPDREQPVYSKEFEEGGSRHAEETDDTWIRNVESIDIKGTDFSQISLTGIDKYFLVYMKHQQGPGGFQRIFSAIKQGLDTVPLRKGKEDINYNMYGSDAFPQPDKRTSVGNVSKDFKQYFGNAHTPSNFIKYWIPKFKENSKTTLGLRTFYDKIFEEFGIKHGVPLNFIKTVCQTESSFNPKLCRIQNNKLSKYKGLFQISLEEFHKVYPGDDDIFNPVKNSNVGIKLLREHADTIQNDIK